MMNQELTNANSLKFALYIKKLAVPQAGINLPSTNTVIIFILIKVEDQKRELR